MRGDVVTELRAWFADPARAAEIDPKRVVWLSDDNIRALAANSRFVAAWEGIARARAK